MSWIRDPEGEARALIPTRIGKHGNTHEWRRIYEEWGRATGIFPICYGLHPHSITWTHPQAGPAARVTLRGVCHQAAGTRAGAGPWITNHLCEAVGWRQCYENIESFLRTPPMLICLTSTLLSRSTGISGQRLAIAEMLVQSTSERNRAASALPGAWNHASVRGLRVRLRRVWM